MIDQPGGVSTISDCSVEGFSSFNGNCLGGPSAESVNVEWEEN